MKKSRNGGVVIGAIVLCTWALGATAWGAERDVAVTLQRFYTPSIDRTTTVASSSEGGRSTASSETKEKGSDVKEKSE